MRSSLFVISTLVLVGLIGTTQQEPRTIPCLIAKLHVADNFIDDHEIVIALDLWIAQSRVGPEIPQPISDGIMIRIIDLWVRGADCRSVLNHGARKRQVFSVPSVALSVGSVIQSLDLQEVPRLY